MVANSRPSSPDRATRDLVALLLEGVLDPAGDGELVLDDQDRGGHGRMLHRSPIGRDRGATSVVPARVRAPFGRSARRGVPRPTQIEPHRGPTPHAHRPPDARRRPARGHRQEGRPPAPRRPPAGRRLRPRRRLDNVCARRPRVRAAPPARSARTRSSTCRSTATRPTPVLVHGVQVHPVNRRPLHVDLFLVRMTEELTVDVPLVADRQVRRRRDARRDAPPRHRARQGPGAAGPPAAVDRVLDRRRSSTSTRRPRSRPRRSRPT